MDTRETVNDKTTQPQGEENSENSNRTTNNNDDDGEEDGARGGVDLQPNAQFDIQTIQQALTAPLPEYDERREREPQQQQTQQQQIQAPAHTQPANARRKMNDILARPAKLRTDGNVAENWKAFRRQLDIFMVASEYSVKSSEIRAAVLLNLIGQDAIDLFDTFALTADERKDYDKVLGAFDAFCKPKTNELFERYKFNKRDQKEGESFDSFLMDIRRLARTCGYKEKEEEMLRDRIVFGIHKSALRTKLLAKEGLTYANAVEKCKADEASHEHSNEMNRTASIDVLQRDNNHKNTQPTQQQQHQHQQQQQQNKHNKKRFNGRQQKQQKPQQASQNSGSKSNGNSKTIENCRRCTYTHKINECPAYGKKCNRCSRPNHFSTACREKKVDSIAASQSESDNENYKEYRVNFDDEFCIDTN